jgi:hypothetical protein
MLKPYKKEKCTSRQRRAQKAKNAFMFGNNKIAMLNY